MGAGPAPFWPYSVPTVAQAQISLLEPPCRLQLSVNSSCPNVETDIRRLQSTAAWLPLLWGCSWLVDGRCLAGFFIGLRRNSSIRLQKRKLVDKQDPYALPVAPVVTSLQRLGVRSESDMDVGRLAVVF
ncbi:hypothetical protein NDU88_001321 [Pleurodeles waltl]|uniref:Uncharacterized protein n=1 Tax=Pleurodeles waltl TaxID=8319 RepID=A0AAV7V7H9_PLEWA|nr:hypothetical protein NDU88_001321 [Pleurodeles waltl]